MNRRLAGVALLGAVVLVLSGCARGLYERLMESPRSSSSVSDSGSLRPSRARDRP